MPVLTSEHDVLSFFATIKRCDKLSNLAPHKKISRESSMRIVMSPMHLICSKSATTIRKEKDSHLLYNWLL